MQCKFVKPDSVQCGARALKSKDLCYFHTENKKVRKQRLKSSSKGGSKKFRIGTCVSTDNYFPLTTIGDVLNLLEFTTNCLLQGKISRSNASCIGYLANITIGAIKDYTFEQRLEVIESALTISKQASKRI